MSEDLQALIESQPDIVKAKCISQNAAASVFRVKQVVEGKKRKQIVKVLNNISNHYALKREKDLLHYLNQFSEFVHFNEIRKADFHYLLFFDDVGKTNLEKAIKKKGSFKQSTARNLLIDMIKSLKTLHEAGFVHANICPENIVVGKKQYYLMGWSQAIPALSSYETENIQTNTLYCPPERLNGTYDEKGDVYNLGCTLYFALTGKHIYRLKKKASMAEHLWAHVHHSVHKMNQLPIFWRYLIFWMTQKDPKMRPTMDDLEEWVDEVSVPEWVRNMSVRVDKSYPQDCLTTLADEHFLFPIYLKALEYEKSGDIENAFNLFENGAFRGYSLAEAKLGQMYEKGSPVQQSYAMAANMYHQAFQKGHPSAAYRLARIFEQGLGMPANLEHAFKLYRHAANRGHLKAQTAVAQMFIDGRGVAKDLSQGKSWLALAANSGSEQAKKLMQTLQNKMAV